MSAADELSHPLSDDEIDRLGELIAAVSGGKGMNVERLDGYFAALLCTPTLVPTDQYLPPIFGGQTMEDFEFSSQVQAQELISARFTGRC